MVKFLVKFFTKGSNISVSIGHGMDLLGNYVDGDGNSIDTKGRIINTRHYFVSNGGIAVDEQRDQEYTRKLSEIIVREFHRINRVFASHLVAFTAFNLWKRQYYKLDLYDFLRLPEEELVIDYADFRETFIEIRECIFKQKSEQSRSRRPFKRQPRRSYFNRYY